MTSDSKKTNQAQMHTMDSQNLSHNNGGETTSGKQSKFAPLRRLFPFLKPYTVSYFIGILGLALANLGLNIFLAQMLMEFTQGTMEVSSQLILVSVGKMAITALAAGILVFFAGRKLISATSRVLRDLRDAFFHNVLNMPIAEIEKRHSGDLLSRATNDVRLAGSVFSQGFQILANTVLTGLGAAVYMVVLDPKLGSMGIAVCTLPLLGNLPFVSPLHRIGKKLQKTKAKLTSGFSDLIQGAEVIRTFNLSETMCKRVDNAIIEVQKAGITQSWLEAGRSAADGIAGLGNLIFVVYATYHAIIDPVLIPVLIALVQLMNPVKQLFSGIGSTVTGIQANLAAGERVLEVLNTPTEPAIYTAAACYPDIESTKFPGTLSEVDTPKPAIVLECLTFRYPGSHENALENISFTVPKGKTVALVGPSGSGKTTLFKILLGLYPPCSGNILVEGESVFETNLESWRQKFSYVPQDAFLFSGSIMDNVKSSSQVTDKENILEALYMAHADSFVRELPDGIQSPVGEKGSRLSGGQRQRIAIARAIVKDAPVLLLDEATSSLDTESEALVQEALQALMKDRTCIVIAHRLATIENVHEIIYLENGTIAEQGTHDHLIAYPGSKYRKLIEQDMARNQDKGLN